MLVSFKQWAAAGSHKCLSQTWEHQEETFRTGINHCQEQCDHHQAETGFRCKNGWVRQTEDRDRPIQRGSVGGGITVRCLDKWRAIVSSFMVAAKAMCKTGISPCLKGPDACFDYVLTMYLPLYCVSRSSTTPETRLRLSSADDRAICLIICFICLNQIREILRSLLSNIRKRKKIGYKH